MELVIDQDPQGAQSVQSVQSAQSIVMMKNDRNGGIGYSGISKSLAEYVHRPVCFVNVHSSLHENVIFTVCALMDNATYIIFIMWNSISG